MVKKTKTGIRIRQSYPMQAFSILAISFYVFFLWKVLSIFLPLLTGGSLAPIGILVMVLFSAVGLGLMLFTVHAGFTSLVLDHTGVTLLYPWGYRKHLRWIEVRSLGYSPRGKRSEHLLWFSNEPLREPLEKPVSIRYSPSQFLSGKDLDAIDDTIGRYTKVKPA